MHETELRPDPAAPPESGCVRDAHDSALVASTRDRGQATTEYALVMLAAALVALLVVAWATSGGGSGKIGQLFDGVIDGILSRVP